MAQNYVVAGSVAIPLVDGSTPAPLSTAASIPFTQRVDFQRVYTGAVTDEVVHFDTLAAAGAKGVLVLCPAGACTIKFNGGTDAWPVAPGGHFEWCNPSTPFPTAALISTTGPATVIFIAVG
jgi:hypothetical protein